jgi:hypothetical protein
MSERNPFQQNPAHPPSGPLQCEEWEALLADALDGTLAAEDTAVFTAHGRDCPMCAEMLAQAKQGQEWMKFLHEEPSAPADLVEKILGRTSGAAMPQLAVAGPAAPLITPHIAHFNMRNSFRDSRILMTAAMAFFSIALTLNLVGIHLTSLRAADLKPSALQTNLTRQFFDAKKQMVSYYERLRVVYEVETKVRELRRDADSEQQNAKPRKDDKQQGSPQSNGHKNGGSRLQGPRNLEPVMCGQPMLARLEHSRTPEHPKAGGTGMQAEVKNFEEKVLFSVNEKADQAERSLA